VQNSIRVGKTFWRNNPFHTDIVAKDRVVRRAHFDHSALFDFTNHAAGDVTSLANGSLGGHTGLNGSLSVFSVYDGLWVKRGCCWHCVLPDFQQG
jgi:hypothetical protein